MWPRGFPSTRIAPSLPTHAHLSWPLPAAGPELYILFYWISGCWVLIWCYLSNGGGSLGDYGREPESEVLGWGPGCAIYKLGASPCLFPFRSLLPCPQMGQWPSREARGLRWGATWKVLLERKRQWLLQLANVHGEVRHLYHLRLQSVTGNRDSRTQVPWI